MKKIKRIERKRGYVEYKNREKIKRTERKRGYIE